MPDHRIDRSAPEHPAAGADLLTPPREEDGQAARWEYLANEIMCQLAAFRRRRRRDKRKALALRVAEVVLPGAVTALVGVHTMGPAQPWQLDLALVLGVFDTALTSVDQFFDHRRLWALRTATVRRLEALTRRVQFHTVGGGAEAQELAACMAVLENILSDDLHGWAQLRDLDAPAQDELES